ncbi:MAG: GTP pyrophosphokinase [Gammaproteobacteria bacterium]|nr:GTP pyrophosphokinase [Gammaproteobacteria bacterium]MDH5650994.1 GTP pyrophosphokinase [Gammaproteobacteria bacterium]
MHLIEKSLEIALKAYTGQLDKAGAVYILHPLRIMAKMTTPEEMAVALLHDVIEDSGFTAQDLLQEGIPGEVVDAVVCLTKRDGESYEDFVDRVSKNSLARRIKLADIEDNINILRLECLRDDDFVRLKKYHAAWKRLSQHAEHNVD